MVLTPSAMVPLGSAPPDFELPDGTGQRFARPAPGAPLLVMFICNHCPYVKHVADALAARTSAWIAQGVAVVAINSNDVANYPDDAPELMVEESERRGYEFPYLFDESQETARAYQAQCTPDFFLYDDQHRLAYRGQFDASRPGQGVATGDDLDAAVQDVLAGRVPETQRPSVGCNIKWK